MSNKVPLLLNPFILVGILLVHPLSAAPYPLGTMTCDDIGAFASEAMRWRKEETMVGIGTLKVPAMFFVVTAKKDVMTQSNNYRLIVLNKSSD